MHAAMPRAPPPSTTVRSVWVPSRQKSRLLAAIATRSKHTSHVAADAPIEECPMARRQLFSTTVAVLALAALAPDLPAAHAADGFTTTPSGLRYLDIRQGQGDTPHPGEACVVHWAGYTKGYQGKRIGNTTSQAEDEPYVFVLGGHEAIPAFEEAVATMKPGGVRRIEVPGERPELGYSRDRSLRFTDDRSSNRKKLFQYRLGPQPSELGGQRALDFVLDENTLQDFNRTLLFDIKLLGVRHR